MSDYLSSLVERNLFADGLPSAAEGIRPLPRSRFEQPAQPGLEPAAGEERRGDGETGRRGDGEGRGDAETRRRGDAETTWPGPTFDAPEVQSYRGRLDSPPPAREPADTRPGGGDEAFSPQRAGQSSMVIPPQLPEERRVRDPGPGMAPGQPERAPHKPEWEAGDAAGTPARVPVPPAAAPPQQERLIERIIERTLIPAVPPAGPLPETAAPARETGTAQAARMEERAARALRPAVPPLPDLLTRSERAAAPQPEPTINVTIGRIEVRAAPPAPAASGPRKTAAQPKTMSLEAYLKSRTNGDWR